MFDDAEVEFVDTEEDLESEDGPLECPAMLALRVDEDETSITVTWNDQTDRDGLVDALVGLMTAEYCHSVVAAISNFGGYSGDHETARFLTEKVLEKMTPVLALKANRPLVPPRMAVQLMMRRGSE